MNPECPGVMDEGKTAFVCSVERALMLRLLKRAYEYLESDYRGAEDADFTDGILNELRTFLGEG